MRVSNAVTNISKWKPWCLKWYALQEVGSKTAEMPGVYLWLSDRHFYKVLKGLIIQ